MSNGGRGYGVGFNRSLRFQVFPVFTLMRMLSFCGLKCTTFLRFKVYHPDELFLSI